MHSRRRRADPVFGSQLRFAEKPARIDVARKPTWGNSSKVIDPSRIRTVIKAGRSSPARIWKAPRRRWTITRSLILLNDRARQSAGCGACGCPN
jgi:hypothetical protein